MFGICGYVNDFFYYDFVVKYCLIFFLIMSWYFLALVTNVKGRMSLSLLKQFCKFFCFFVLKVNIYLQNMRKTFCFVVFVCSVSPSIINNACPNFRTTCAMALMFTLQHEFELATLPSIPAKVMLVTYVTSYFIIIRQNFYPVSVSIRIN